MAHTAQVTITLPEDVLQAVETARCARNESRDEFFHRAVERLLSARRDEPGFDEAYIRGYQQFPETPEEVAENWAVSQPVLAAEVWE
jgi:metal-responsive CopG/Arc/MetJ family transcriptional regulator